MTTMIFDIETIPDVVAGRKLRDLSANLPDTEVANAMYALRRQDTGSDFLQLHLHKIVAISVVVATLEQVKVWSLGDIDSAEPELIERFFAGIERYKPTLVSWNGTGFDLPVLHYRSLLHGIEAKTYWDTGKFNSDFKWNNYLNRYHTRHTDVMDILGGYRGGVQLTEVAQMLGFPGKMGLSGAKVWDDFCAGKIGAIRDYCETDVLNTYLIYLRLNLIRGELTTANYQQQQQNLIKMLDQSDKQHLQQFAKIWNP